MTYKEFRLGLEAGYGNPGASPVPCPTLPVQFSKVLVI